MTDSFVRPAETVIGTSNRFEIATKNRIAVGASLWSVCSCLLLATAQLLGEAGLHAAEPAKPKDNLSLQQQQIRRDYERFERSLLEAAENLRRKEPEQSDILDRARERSQEQALLGEMEKIATELKQNQTGSASDRQRQVIDRMKEILQLLQSEDERDRLQREMERIQDLLKDTNRVIGKQRDAKASNQKGGDQQKAESDQKKAAEEAQKLANKIDKQDQARNGQPKPTSGKKPESKDSPSTEPKEGEPKDSPESESKSGEPQPKDGDKPKAGDDKDQPKSDQPDSDKPQSGDPMPADSPGKPSKSGETPPKPGKPSKPMDGQESPPSQSPPSDQPPMPGSPMPPMPGQQPPSPMDPQPPQEQQPPRTEGRDELKEAQESMQKAIEELEQKSRDAAGKDQERALEELEQLKAKLEEILRQIREEEKELYLAMLEVRFQKMLRLQLQINAETTRLEKIPQAERNPAHFDKCNEVSRQQNENLIEADKALVLLKEEGSSVAFPEAVEQMRGNMESVVDRLTRADTGDTTQLLEQIVQETLEEILLALQKEMEAARQKKQPGQKQKPQGSPEDQKLVNQLAELKMIRSLQNQVNRITKQIGIQIEGEQSADPDQRKLTEDLSKRQQRIQAATYDLSTGRNK